MPHLPSRVEKRKVPDRPLSAMSLTDLQMMAKAKGIPFGGLSKSMIVKKLQRYF